MSRVAAQRAPDPSAATRHSGRPEAQPCGGLSRDDLEHFAREYAGRLQAVARRLLRSEEDAADAVQDALLSAVRARHRFQGESTVYTWLYRIVVNACLMQMRSRRGGAVMSLHEMPGGAGQIPTAGAKGAGERAEERLGRSETQARVRSCVDELPEGYREIIVLRDLEGHDTTETARLLQVSRGAVKTRLHRARQALGAVLVRRGMVHARGQQPR
jgi:RNA polymerase sigma-70 factor (ECF subfamily)